MAILLVDPSCRRRGPEGPVVLLDGSRSMTDPGSDARWRAAVDSARAAAGRRGRILLFGGPEPRIFTGAERPDAPTSLLGPALREAASRGGRLVVVTDGLVDDAPSLPADLVRDARIVVLPRPPRPDAGILQLDLPAALRAGDTASATVDVVVQGAAPGDTAGLELLEAGRVVARARLSLGGGTGTIRRTLTFVPAPVRAPAAVRRYEARLRGFARDAEPRDDRVETAAVVSRGSTIVLLSDSPDWDFRWLARTLAAQSGVPVHAWLRLGPSGWHDARTMRPASARELSAEASAAALLVVHGTEAGVRELARLGGRSVLEWIARGAPGGAAASWYVTAPDVASPAGAPLAGIPADSLPPLEAVLEVHPDSVVWTGLVAQVDRRGRGRPVVVGTARNGRRVVLIAASGLWRWASHGGLAEQGYRSLVAALTDWLIEDRSGAPPDLVALRDSLAVAVTEYVPRSRTLASQAGVPPAAAGEPEPVRFSPWLYVVAVGALVFEWVARRRRGLR